jgi:cation transport protein ChaC
MSHEAHLQPHPDATYPELPAGDLWVFAYGSLLWRPGFGYLQRLPARLYGYHRSLCVWSHTHRGTEHQPGMVLGLDRGGSCRGCVYQVAASQTLRVSRYLFAREMPTPVYHACFHPVQLQSGQRVQALTFIVDRQSPQYAGRLSATQIARHLRQARGISGSSRDYLTNTIEHLELLGLHDPHLSEIANLLNRTKP